LAAKVVSFYPARNSRQVLRVRKGRLVCLLRTAAELEEEVRYGM
jgi:hypothetical protein